MILQYDPNGIGCICIGSLYKLENIHFINTKLPSFKKSDILQLQLYLHFIVIFLIAKEMVCVGSTLMGNVELLHMHTFRTLRHVVKFTLINIKIDILDLEGYAAEVLGALLHELGHSLGSSHSDNPHCNIDT